MVSSMVSALILFAAFPWDRARELGPEAAGAVTPAAIR
jgi:hypothetical protein